MSVSEQTAHLCASLLNAGLDVQFRVRGWSMKPFLRSGDRVRIAPSTGEETRGDVVLVQASDSRLVLHRIVTDEPGRMATKGDA